MLKTDAAPTQIVDDALMFRVHDAWLQVPDDVAEGLCWWQMVLACQRLRTTGQLLAASALFDVTIVICRSQADVNNVDWSDGRRNPSVLDGARLLLADETVRGVAVCLFSYRELTGESVFGS